MRHWVFMGFALVGGFLLLNGALSDLLPLLARIQVVVAVLFLGSGRRMLQQRLHRQPPTAR